MEKRNDDVHNLEEYLTVIIRSLQRYHHPLFAALVPSKPSAVGSRSYAQTISQTDDVERGPVRIVVVVIQFPMLA